MKIVPSKSSDVKSDYQLCITLEEPPKRDPDSKEKPIGFTCSRDPTDKDAPTYTLKAFPFDDGDNCEQFLKTREIYEAVKQGQAITTNENRVTLVRQLFKGAALTAFDNEITDANVSDDMYKKAWKAMTAAVFPSKAARNQKKAMKKLK